MIMRIGVSKYNERHPRSRHPHLVEKVHLHRNGECDCESKDPGSWSPELVVARQCDFDGDAESFHGHDRDRPHERADRDVDQWVAAAMNGRHFVYHIHRENGDK